MRDLLVGDVQRAAVGADHDQLGIPAGGNRLGHGGLGDVDHADGVVLTEGHVDGALVGAQRQPARALAHRNGRPNGVGPGGDDGDGVPYLVTDPELRIRRAGRTGAREAERRQQDAIARPRHRRSHPPFPVNR